MSSQEALEFYFGRQQASKFHFESGHQTSEATSADLASNRLLSNNQDMSAFEDPTGNLHPLCL